MSKLKVAVLEDNKQLLKDLKQNLEDTELVEVVAWATSSEEFFKKISENKVDALLLDIDLGGDSMNGLDVAEKLKLPVLFVSGKTRDFYQGIEDLNINSEISVEHITKPITLEKLKKILPKFIQEISALKKREFIPLSFLNSGKRNVELDTIVFLTSEGEDSNNKEIYFTNCPPEILIDFSFKNMAEKGFDENLFLTTHRAYRVNAEKITAYRPNHRVEVTVMNKSGKPEKKLIPVSENYQPKVKRLFE